MVVVVGLLLARAPVRGGRTHRRSRMLLAAGLFARGVLRVVVAVVAACACAGA